MFAYPFAFIKPCNIFLNLSFSKFFLVFFIIADIIISYGYCLANVDNISYPGVFL